MVICKSITQNRGWPVQHKGLTSAAYSVYLSQTNAQSDGTNSWNSTAASSTVTTLGNDANNNRVDDNDQYIMYSFAEKSGYSKFGTFTANQNVNGTYVHLGFSAAFIIVKNRAAQKNWYMFNNKTLGFNPLNDYLDVNTNEDEESGNNQIDILANGFKLKSGGTGTNKSGDKYIFMAFAASPFVTSTGIPTTAR